jgi:DNA-binding NarL/FixJ family response regulator
MTPAHLQLVRPPSVAGDHSPHHDELRVLLVENHMRIRHCLAGILAGSSEIEVAEERIDPDTILERIRQWAPDVVSLAVQLDGAGGFELLDRLHREAPEAPVVVLTMQRSGAFAQRALERGASGVVLKDHADTELVPAVQAVALGETYVSPLISLC